MRAPRRRRRFSARPLRPESESFIERLANQLGMGKAASEASPGASVPVVSGPVKSAEWRVRRAFVQAGGAIADVPVKEAPHGGVLSAEAVQSLGPHRIADLLDLDIRASKAKYADALAGYVDSLRLK